MKKLKVYLAKSNRANPDVVTRARQILSKFNLEIVEFKGGSYSHKQLLECDYLVVVPEGLNSSEVSVGKGLYEQIKTFKRQKQNTKFEDVLFISEENCNINEILGLSIEDTDDYQNFGWVFLDYKFETESIEEVLRDIVSDFYYGSGLEIYSNKTSKPLSTSKSNYYHLIGKNN